MATPTYSLRGESDAPLTQPLPKAAAEPVAVGRVAGEKARPVFRRLASLDAYRGLIMLLLMSGGFGIADLAARPADDGVWTVLDYETWQRIAFHFEHPPWLSRFGVAGVSAWDLIQPAFMLMVGVSVPFSLARRERLGQSKARVWLHTLWRCVLLVALGVFLRSVGFSSTRWEFVNVLAQIGLGYWLVVLLAKQGYAVIGGAIAAILLAYGLLFYVSPPPADYDFTAAGAYEDGVLEEPHRAWSMNGNLAHRFDLWLLNRFIRPDGVAYVGNPGGYQTLNFVPSIATMLLGLICGRVLIAPRSHLDRLLRMTVLAVACVLAGIALDETACPIVKRIWTPSWTLFSGGWAMGLLVVFYVLCDILPLRKLFVPLIVLGANSLLMYLLGQLAIDWTSAQIDTHLGSVIRYWTPPRWTPADWQAVVVPFLVVAAFWAVAA